MVLNSVEKPLGKWYYRMENTGILFPTYFKNYYTTTGITPIDFVWDNKLGAVVIQHVGDSIKTYDTEHNCIDIFLLEQLHRGHYMNHWDLTINRHRDLFEIFMEKYVHIIFKDPHEGANKIYIEMEKELTKYK